MSVREVIAQSEPWVAGGDASYALYLSHTFTINAVVLAIGAVQIFTDLLFSVRSSDWKKVLRERAIAREVEALNE